jgi:hypothetical protein
METIAEYMEDCGNGSGTHHTLYFCGDSGTFILESVGVAFNDGDISLEDFNDSEALEWCVEFAGMPYMAAARAIIGADEDMPL